MVDEDNGKHIQMTSFEPFAKLLKQAAPAKAVELDKILQVLNPVCEIDRQSERILFQASRNPTMIRFGMECTCRLQAHAYVAAIFINAISTPGYLNIGLEEKRKLYEPADHLLNWAVAHEIQQALQSQGHDIAVGDLFGGLGKELPEGLLGGLNEVQVSFGEGLFRLAVSFILLHEIAHLHLGHVGSSGAWSVEQEKEADRFAAAWLLDAADDSSKAQIRRINVLFGIAVALLWITVLNVYLGPQQSSTHPEAYDRLFQVMDEFVDSTDIEESSMVWYLVANSLFVHMDHAKYEIDAERMDCSPRDEVNYLIDLLANSNSQ